MRRAEVVSAASFSHDFKPDMVDGDNVRGGVWQQLVFGLALCLAVLASGGGLVAAADSCVKADFEAVVDEAAGVLRDLNLKNKPAFQDKLRLLKDKRGWTHEAFLKEAAPFVRDEEIARLDQASEDLLTKISSMGQEGAGAKSLDCGLIGKLRGFMSELVAAQTRKWAHMFGKIDKELAR